MDTMVFPGLVLHLVGLEMAVGVVLAHGKADFGILSY